MGMGKVELEAREKRHKQNIQNAVLMTVAAVGIIAAAAVAPNAIQLLKTSGTTAKLRYRAKSVLGRLKQKGDIEFIERDGKKCVRLTEKGERTLALHREKLRLAELPKKRWDWRYRLVIFDVPEKRKGTRDRIRREVHEAGFLRVQDSAWIYPYDCEEFIALLKAELHIGKDVLYAIIDSIENDKWIRKHFGLPQK